MGSRRRKEARKEVGTLGPHQTDKVGPLGPASDLSEATCYHLLGLPFLFDPNYFLHPSKREGPSTTRISSSGRNLKAPQI